MFFEEQGIGSPPTWLPAELPDELPFPVLVKARKGFGSRHIYRADDQTRARLLPALHDGRLDGAGASAAGEEFSIDVFCDLDGALPRTRCRAR